MRVLLLNIDSKLPNIALHKIKMWHELQGDEVVWGSPIEMYGADKVYASCIFTKNKYKADSLLGLNPNISMGGSGYSLDINLPEEIESMKPKINYGFTTRGCIRNCKFCIVTRKEGKIRATGDLLDLWDGKTKLVTVMDNNILALPKHFEMVCNQAREHSITLDFNQGLDHRLLTPELLAIMKSISHKEYRFAFDNPASLPTVERAIKMMRDAGINRCNWYVLVGFDTTPEDDLMRLNYLRDNGQRAYVQRYETHFYEPFYVGLARWVNQPHLFVGMTWEQFLNYPRPDHKRLKEAITKAEASIER